MDINDCLYQFKKWNDERERLRSIGNFIGNETIYLEGLFEKKFVLRIVRWVLRKRGEWDDFVFDYVSACCEEVGIEFFSF